MIADDTHLAATVRYIHRNHSIFLESPVLVTTDGRAIGRISGSGGAHGWL